MKKLVFLLSFLLSVSISGYSQIYVDNQGNVHDQRQKTTQQSTVKSNKSYNSPSSSFGFDMSKLTVGGGIGLQFGDYTVINVSPQVGYDFTKYFTAGAGIGYTYFKDSRNYNYDFKNSYLSFNLFARAYPIQYLVVGIQPEISRMWQTTDTGRESHTVSEVVPSFLVGAGLRVDGIIAMIQYDVVQDENSPYGNNIFYSLGYTFRF